MLGAGRQARAWTGGVEAEAMARNSVVGTAAQRGERLAVVTAPGRGPGARADVAAPLDKAFGAEPH